MGLFDKTNGHGDIEFEREYRDRITGFVGKAVGISRYVSGCDQVCLSAPAKDGKQGDSVWFDDDCLIDIEKERQVKRTSRKGGPQASPAPAR
jgi:hypothetical protein